MLLDARQPDAQARIGKELDKGIDGHGFKGPVNNEVQIVGADAASAEKFENGSDRQDLPHRQRRDADQLSSVSNSNDEQSPVAAQMLPPTMQPFPRKKDAVRTAGGKQIIPLATHRRKRGEILDDINANGTVDSGRLRRLRDHL